ncbi:MULTISPECIES: ATP-dependent Clp protease adapter ClpS [Helcobacillus]|uniref:ATP-dependent Clp protease adapter protein ClpS n=1 Tax=Helcobacillus massiliensis TaxID=521392 RepID=A0A839QPY3_9MICO|nr:MULTISPECIES: ATP-dependent Clp protease adapter ClpS [Helcobacillus]MBB3022052.1 ATP-dependent Clp protease adaptor protein ClpS [Helcobacillus massiliensis]MCG7426919.1 ATP-dependent Clp protease adapter ClpS [Helcobacillus sp. ACRRO]MDK7742293.1 ATP-dependent Clp protease adapter ClpS [Helcobacillus massiliensis]WOO93543.1 ATP-dependent Clp protease adapter ClpS [Helcobacillus massiliensis]
MVEASPERRRTAPALSDADRGLEQERDTAAIAVQDRLWNTVVWNDPINLQSYVVHVLRTHFGYDRQKAERLMLQVHHEGRAIVSTDPRESAEGHVQAMHAFGLNATLEQQEG